MNRPFLQDFPPWRVGEQEMKARRICWGGCGGGKENIVLDLSMMILQSPFTVTSKKQVDGAHTSSYVKTPGQPG